MSVLSAVQRSLIALGVAGVVAVVLKIKGNDATPPRDGGWRELSGPDLR